MGRPPKRTFSSAAHASRASGVFGNSSLLHLLGMSVPQFPTVFLVSPVETYKGSPIRLERGGARGMRHNCNLLDQRKQAGLVPSKGL